LRSVRIFPSHVRIRLGGGGIVTNRHGPLHPLMVLPQAALPGPLELTKLKGKAIHVHISDCDGKVHGNLPPGRGVIKFEPYLQAIKELDINCTVSVEL
jgi:hypothetical protein